MSAKEIEIFNRRARKDAARRRHSRQRGQGHARPQGAQCRDREVLRRAAHQQGRRDRRQGDRAQGQVREHGRADGARGREQAEQRGGRRHDDRDRDRTGDRQRGREGGRGGRQSDGRQARNRCGGEGGQRASREEQPQGHEIGRDRPGRHDLGQWRQVDRRLDCAGHGQGGQGGRDHGRGSQDRRDRARRRRGHAVRPRLSLALFHHQRREDAGRARGPLYPHPREEALLAPADAAHARGGGADRQAAAHHRRGHRGRGAGDAGGQQAARRLEGRGGQGAGLRRPPQGDARGHRHPHRAAR